MRIEDGSSDEVRQARKSLNRLDEDLRDIAYPTHPALGPANLADHVLRHHLDAIRTFLAHFDAEERRRGVRPVVVYLDRDETDRGLLDRLRQEGVQTDQAGVLVIPHGFPELAARHTPIDPDEFEEKLLAAMQAPIPGEHTTAGLRPVPPAADPANPDRWEYLEPDPELPADPTGVDCPERYESPQDQA